MKIFLRRNKEAHKGKIKSCMCCLKGVSKCNKTAIITVVILVISIQWLLYSAWTLLKTLSPSPLHPHPSCTHMQSHPAHLSYWKILQSDSLAPSSAPGVFLSFSLQPRLVQDVQAALPASDPRPTSRREPTVWKLYSARRLPHRGTSQLHGRSEIPPAASHEGRPAFKNPL